MLRLSWLLLVASVALSTLLQVAVAPPTLVGYLTAGATPVWLLGSFAVLSLLYRTPAPIDPVDGENRAPAGGEPSKRERARAALVAAGPPRDGGHERAVYLGIHQPAWATPSRRLRRASQTRAANGWSRRPARRGGPRR